eukprot:2240002-Alexandrium_andersonii.AAC.1
MARFTGDLRVNPCSKHGSVRQHAVHVILRTRAHNAQAWPRRTRVHAFSGHARAGTQKLSPTEGVHAMWQS